MSDVYHDPPCVMLGDWDGADPPWPLLLLDLPPSPASWDPKNWFAVLEALQ